MEDGSIQQKVDYSTTTSASKSSATEATSISIDANIPLKIHHFLEQGGKNNWPADFLTTLIANGIRKYCKKLT